MNLLAGIPSLGGLDANHHRAQSRGETDVGHINPFEDDKHKKPKPPPKMMTEKDAQRSYQFISNLADAARKAFDADAGITETMTRDQIRSNPEQRRALAKAQAFVAYAIGQGMAVSDLSKYGVESPLGSMIMDSMNISASDESNSSIYRHPVGRYYFAARDMANYAVKAKEGMDQLLGFASSPGRAIKSAVQTTQVGISMIAGPVANGVKVAMPIIRATTQLLKLANSARDLKTSFGQWIHGAEKTPAIKKVLPPSLRIDASPAIDTFAPGGQPYQAQSIYNDPATWAAIDALSKSVASGGYVQGGFVPQPVLQQNVPPMQTQPPPVLNPTQFAGLGNAPEATTWLWIMAGAVSLYMMLSLDNNPEQR